MVGSKSEFGLADPTEGIPRHVSHLAQVIFRGQEKLTCPGRLLEVLGGLDCKGAAMGMEPIPTQAQHHVVQLQAQGPAHPGAFVCNSYCVIKTVLLKEMGTFPSQLRR